MWEGWEEGGVDVCFKHKMGDTRKGVFFGLGFVFAY